MVREAQPLEEDLPVWVTDDISRLGQIGRLSAPAESGITEANLKVIPTRSLNHDLRTDRNESRGDGPRWQA